MRDISVSDATMSMAAETGAVGLTFKEKLETAKLLDRLGVSVIEVEGIAREKVDLLRIKSIASIVRGAALAVPVALDGSDAEAVSSALAEAPRSRLQVVASLSPARMEYVHHLKPDAMAEAVEGAVARCRALGRQVELVARDATRADAEYLRSVVARAARAGAEVVTVCDDAGAMLPEEFARFVAGLREDVPELAGVSLGVSCSNAMYMADACAVAAVMAGADEVKASSYPLGFVSTDRLAKILHDRSDAVGASCGVRAAEMDRIVSQVRWVCEARRPKDGAPEPGRAGAAAEPAPEDDVALVASDDVEAVTRAAARLGYDLSPEDAASVYEAFQRIATKKGTVGSRELDAIVASSALQVPPTYVLESYVINSGNLIRATAHVRVRRGEEELESLAVGDGPIDAAFMALEKAAGEHYALADFQIQAVTQGQEAMGQTVIKLEHGGKVYPGIGISTDVIGSSIRAFVNALNKIAYDEQEEGQAR